MIEDNYFSNNLSTSFDEININNIETNQLYRGGLENTENNNSYDCVRHSSYIAICNSLYNNIKMMSKYLI